MQSAMGNYYSVAAIRHSLRHFLVGKGFKVFSSLAIIVLLARHLKSQEYAVYVSLQAITTIGAVITSGGIQAILLRYLPELRAADNNVAVYRLLRDGMLLRVAIIGTWVLVALPFVPFLVGLLHLHQWGWLLGWYLLVGLLNLTVLTLSQALESLYWQKEAQYVLALGSMAKLAAVIGAMSANRLDLVAVVLIEGCTEGLTLILMLYAWYTRWRADDRRDEGNLAWWQENRRRVIRYGWWSFFVNQTKALYGSPNRLVAAHFLPHGELAVYGFVANLTGLARRFMPTRLLIGLVRPLFMARFAATGDFQQLVRMANFAYRLNMLIFLLPIALLLVAGKPLFAWLTAGKYPAAAALLAGFLVLMITEGMRNLAELLVQAVEQNQVFLLSNLVQSASLFVAIPLFPWLGYWALPVANFGGTVIANVIVLQWLRHRGYVFHLDVGLVLLMLGYGAAAGATGWWVLALFGSPALAALISTGIYGLLCLINPPFSRDERALVKRLLSGKSRARRVPVVANEA